MGLTFNFDFDLLESDFLLFDVCGPLHRALSHVTSTAPSTQTGDQEKLLVIFFYLQVKNIKSYLCLILKVLNQCDIGRRATEWESGNMNP